MSTRDFCALGRQSLLMLTLAAGFLSPLPGRADVITDWDAKAAAVASAAALGEREVTIVDLAMFDAVNSLAQKYPAYRVREGGFAGASPEAAAASAAATALASLHPEKSADFKAALAEYLTGLPAPHEAMIKGVQLGERVAQAEYQSRANDGATATDPYRPRTQPGVYVPTTTMVCPTWPMLRPFVLSRPEQFRPAPPVALSSKEWAADFNEIKTYGARDSTQRTAEQTETARFWLMTGPNVYHPIARQIDAARHLPLIDSARFMAMFAVALTDAYIAVFDAKYHYEFWRPVTAIRNGDIDGNPDTERDPSWQPLDATPMHPEYPCAHCILSAAAAAVIEATGGLGALPEISLTSTTAPGVTHRWSNLERFTTEVANARIWAGFHYRSSTRVGSAMGREVGHYVATHFAQPDQTDRLRK
ncbi:MAG TPA: vanadium-dependent haloperoxidase [Steroidobacteraceae bacterium]